jgi:phenylpropionate dioxygenase-like ring-hydroxylating dioxygenase large terminal subunit
MPVVIFRTEAGDIGALRNYCSHRRAPLSMGRVVGEAIECPYHGMQFSGTGSCVKIPCQDMIPERANIPAFEVAERYGVIWLWYGDEPADLGKLPALPWREDPALASDVSYHYHVKANHLLMTDNLLDLGHVAFIHADTIGFDPAALEHDPLKTEVEGDVVRNTRIISNAEPSPNARNWGQFEGLVERGSISNWYPPHYTSILFTNRDARSAVDLYIDHFITPETEKSHNYWIVMSRNFGIDDPTVRDRVHADNDKVHQQDLAIVEAQQRMIDLAPNYQDMPIRQDKGLVQAHRIMDRLYRRQKQAASADAA